MKLGDVGSWRVYSSPFKQLHNDRKKEQETTVKRIKGSLICALFLRVLESLRVHSHQACLVRFNRTLVRFLGKHSKLKT